MLFDDIINDKKIVLYSQDFSKTQSASQENKFCKSFEKINIANDV